jgi:signal peptidase II
VPGGQAGRGAPALSDGSDDVGAGAVEASAAARAARSRRGSLATILYAIAAGVFVVDRVTKVWAEHSLRFRPPIVLIPRVLDLSYTTNSGGAFSLFTGVPWVFFAASVGISAAIVWMSARLTSVWNAVGLGLVLGGAIGNMTDRLTRGTGVSGQVVDFIHLHLWPTFNVADSSIVVGAIALAAAGLLGASHPAPATPGL